MGQAQGRLALHRFRHVERSTTPSQGRPPCRDRLVAVFPVLPAPTKTPTHELYGTRPSSTRVMASRMRLS